MTNNKVNRLLALDVFRGMTITAMILVNNPGSWSHVYPPLLHADWNGWTPTDLIFPFFVFIVGVSISYAIKSLSERGISKNEIIKMSLIRMMKLFSLGLFLALFYYNFLSDDFDWFEERLFNIRVLGVLQRIALVYFCSVILILTFSSRTLIFITAALLVFYSALLFFVPYSNDNGEVFIGLLEKGNSLTAWLDHYLLGAEHVYYKSSLPFSSDPEGILSTFPAISTCLTGYLVGVFLQKSEDVDRSLARTITLLIIVGLVSVILAKLLSFIIPINKFFWSASYVLLTSGLASIFLAVLIYLLDIKNYQKWSFPFIVFGANSILFFMFSGIVARIIIMFSVSQNDTRITLKAWLFNVLNTSFNDPKIASLVFALCFLLFSYVIMWFLYKKNFFWKV